MFSDTSFQLSPAQGSIWPGMEAEITVTFEPDHAREYKATAYCDVGGRASRLPIQLCGTGLGPKAVFSYDLLDVGEAFINTPHKYEVELLNRCAVGYWLQDEPLLGDSRQKTCMLNFVCFCQQSCSQSAASQAACSCVCAAFSSLMHCNNVVSPLLRLACLHVKHCLPMYCQSCDHRPDCPRWFLSNACLHLQGSDSRPIQAAAF